MIRKIAASIVTYNPQASDLQTLTHTLLKNMDRVYIFDNNSTSFPSLIIDDRVEVFKSEENIGVAAGHNFCLQKAFDSGAEAVILFDQDSKPEANMVPILVRSLNALRENGGGCVAAVGPVLCDSRPHGMVFQKPAAISILPQDGDGCLAGPVDFLITSGALIPRDAWLKVGSMKEGFFIDAIDTEWGLRAKSMGWTSYVAPYAHMEHFIGDDLVRVPFRKTYISAHAPHRYYYIIRNFFFLAKLTYIPRTVAMNLRAQVSVMCATVVIRKRSLRMLRYIMLGCLHAWRSRLGRLDTPV